MIVKIEINTPLGPMTAASAGNGICLLEFGESRADRSLDIIRKLAGESIVSGESDLLLLLKEELKEYFDGARKIFSVPVRLFGTDFQLGVWNGLKDIGYGTTRTYMEQAESLGVPLSIRAVANANGKNPVSIIIPCHRVIGSGGSLTGYGGGIERKKWLIGHEKKYSGQPFELTVF